MLPATGSCGMVECARIWSPLSLAPQSKPHYIPHVSGGQLFGQRRLSPNSTRQDLVRTRWLPGDSS
jgi:hypothetical protein